MEKNLPQRFIVIGVVLVVALLLLWPPGQKLRPGIDIAGGVSMIFEIDDRGMENMPELAEEMKRLLQRRVDPQGVHNLIWRVHGRNRLEVQMPLPPKGAAQAREEYLTAQQELFASNIGRGKLEAAFRLAADQRTAEIERLAGGSAQRKQLMLDAAARYDEYRAAVEAAHLGPPAAPPTTAATTEPAPPVTQKDLDLRVRDVTEALEDAIDAVLATNLDPQRFRDVLDLEETSSIRKNTLAQMEQEHPALKAKMEEVIVKHAAWRANRGGLDGPADLRRLMRGAGVLEFRILAEPSTENITKYDRYREQLRERGPRPRPGDAEGWFKIDNPMAFFNLDSPQKLAEFDPLKDHLWVVDKYGDDYYVLSKISREHSLLAPKPGDKQWALKYASDDRDEVGRLCVHFLLDPVGGQMFRELTSKNVNKQLCILVDGVAYSAANIQEAIGSSGRITGDFSRDKVVYLVNTMQAGALPARLKDTPLSERTIGSSLGETNLRKAVVAGIIGSIAVILAMAGYYLLCGLIANVALLMNVVLILAAMAMLGARFTLDGIAGVILSIGMAVDANVLIFERMREEKARGSSLRMVIKNGFDKAFTTIFDSNITTLLTCVILYYVGSEEIKGFGLTLGWGIALNLFTSVFLTRTIFTGLVKYHLIKDVKMLHFIKVPKIDWYGKRKYFIPLSIVIVSAGLVLMGTRSRQDVLDVEFLGGVNVEIELKKPTLDDVQIADRLKTVGSTIAADGRRLRDAALDPVPGDPTTFRVGLAGVTPERLAGLLAEPLEDAGLLRRGGAELRGGEAALLLHVAEGVTTERLRDFIVAQADKADLAGQNIVRSNVGSVLDVGSSAQKGLFWSVTTTETNKRLVQHALETALGDDLRTQPRIGYVFRGQEGRPYPITNRRLESLVPGLPSGAGGDLSDFLGGAAMYFDQLDPPQTLDALRTRLRNMRLQPDYQDYPWRAFEVFGVTPAGPVDGLETYAGVVIAVADQNFMYSDDPEQWATELAQKEYQLATAALDREQTLRKVSQFKPQIATQSQTRALLAMLLSWGMIIAYVWIRFGRVMYGIAGVIALVHDVLIALAFVGFSGLLVGWAPQIAGVLRIEDFKINMPVIAALLTIIGFSINDTIVIFDRVRETRGRLGRVTPEIINRSINECMSRTILTTFTVFLTLLAMYIFGGSSIRGFNYCMLIGVISGTYSTVALAAPLLLLKVMRRGPAPAGATA